MAEGTAAVRTYLSLSALFGTLSLLAIGGANTVLADMHRNAVGGHHWLTDAQFADVFAISQTAPGPSVLIVALIGYAAGLSVGGVFGGVVGGIVATMAMVIPAAILVYAVTLGWNRAKDSKLRHAVERGFAPLAVGLILATSLVMSRTADSDWRAYLLTAVCTVVFVRTDVNPLIVVAAAGLIGYLGFV